MKRAGLFIVISLLASSASASSGLTGAPVLNTPIGARSTGMGRAFTAIPGDPETINYNPGALAFARGTNVSATYMSGFLDGSYGFLAAPVQLGAFVLTPAYFLFDSGSIDLKFSDPAKTPVTVTAESDKVVYLSAAWQPAAGLGIGATVKRASLELAETASASATLYDIGVLYSGKGGLSLGASLLNSGGDIKFETQGDPAPRTKKAGASYKFDINPPDLLDPGEDIIRCEMLLSADWTRTDEEKGYYQGGTEIKMTIPRNLAFAFRLGYLAGRDSAGMTYGLGLRVKSLGIDFSFTPSEALDSVSQATLSYKF
jgi:hypothetical protein